jgi:hypothetical protein
MPICIDCAHRRCRLVLACLLRTLEVLGSSIGPRLVVVTEAFDGILQSLQADTGTTSNVAATFLFHTFPSLLFCDHPLIRRYIIYLSMALQAFVGSWPLVKFLELFTQSVCLLGRGISPSQGRYLHTGQHKHRINAHRHQCLKWDSKPRFQYARKRRQFMPYTGRPL